jgi:hypothetical protein
MTEDQERKAERASVTLPGKVEKIIPGVIPGIAEKAQIVIEGADALYQEIRIPNVFETENGKEVSLKKGADVDVTIDAPGDTPVK